MPDPTTIEAAVVVEKTKSPKWHRLVPANGDWDRHPFGALNVRTTAGVELTEQYDLMLVPRTA